jgi:hypothetical protein
MIRQHRAQDLGVEREGVAPLDPGIAGLPGFPETLVERGAAAELGQIVVEPGDRCDAEPDGAGSRVGRHIALPWCAGARAIGLARARLLPFARMPLRPWILHFTS